MLIDWFTVGAQVLNFIILVGLLKRFLYKPILDAIDARERRITAELAAADTSNAQAQQERDDFRYKNQVFDQQRDNYLSQAMQEAKAERERLIDEARRAADTLSHQRSESLKTAANDLKQAIRSRTAQEVFAIARKTLMDLASTDLDESMVAIFINRLRSADEELKVRLVAAFTAPASEPARVRSVFELSSEQRITIQNLLNEIVAADVQLRFETTPDLISGIELSAGGQKVAWSISDYLMSLEKGVSELLNVTGDSPELSGIQSEKMPILRSQ